MIDKLKKNIIALHFEKTNKFNQILQRPNMCRYSTVLGILNPNQLILKFQ